MNEAIKTLTEAINKDIAFYTSSFCQRELTEEQRKELLHRMQGKKEALELISGKQYRITAEGLVTED